MKCNSHFPDSILSLLCLQNPFFISFMFLFFNYSFYVVDFTQIEVVIIIFTVCFPLTFMLY